MSTLTAPRARPRRRRASRRRASRSSCRSTTSRARCPRSIRRLHEHLSAELPFAWRIVIADNASTDETPRIAAALADDLPGVELLDLAEKGRGRALRAAWCAQRRRRPLLHGRRPLDRPARAAAARRAAASPATATSRSAPAWRAARTSCAAPSASSSRAPTTGCCTLTLGARFSDAQCGFKAIRADVARRLLPRVARRGLVLRHRAARARPARGPAHPRGAGRLGRRPGLARGHRAHRGRRPARDRPAAGRRAARALPGRRRVLDARLRAALPRCCARRSAPAGRTRSRSR